MIEFFSLEIRSYSFNDRIEKELEIRINIDGMKYTYRKILFPDDLTSFYDQLFDIAKHKLKEEISKEK